MDLKNYTDEQLKEELENRKKQTIEPPAKIEDPDTTALEQMVDDYVDWVWSPEYHDDNDWTEYIYEAAINAFYGPEFWKRKRKRMTGAY